MRYIQNSNWVDQILNPTARSKLRIFTEGKIRWTNRTNWISQNIQGNSSSNSSFVSRMMKFACGSKLASPRFQVILQHRVQNIAMNIVRGNWMEARALWFKFQVEATKGSNRNMQNPTNDEIQFHSCKLNMYMKRRNMKHRMHHILKN